MKPVRTWIVIADGARARIVKNAGPGRGVESDSKLVFRSEHRKLQEIMADKPGRGFDSVGKGRHAMAYGADALAERATGLIRDIFEAPKRRFSKMMATSPTRQPRRCTR